MSDDLRLHDLDLSGRWRAIVADEELRRTWQRDDFDDAHFVEIGVPGHWRRHEAFAESDGPLLYRRHFQSLSLPEPSRAWLVLDGLCSQGDVWLDGAYLGDTEGAFSTHRFEVTDALRDRHDHLLGIEVTSPPISDRRQKRSLTGTWQDGPYVSPGWNPGGLWRGVRVHRTGPVAISGRRVICTEASPGRAIVSFWATLDARDACEVTLRTIVAGHDHVQLRNLAAGANQVSWTVPIAEPPLWWPHALGDQPLVDVSVEVLVDDVVDGVDDIEPIDASMPTADVETMPRPDDTGTPTRHSDGFSLTTGLRAVAMHDWVLRVNGERLFVKGVLAGPLDEALGTAPAESFAAQVARVRDAGLDLLRVHGHLSRPELYEAADRAGVLVWQDLPLYRGQHRSVRRAAAVLAKATVDELGAHPSIVVWCGHDEPDDAEPDQPAPRPRSLARLLAAHELPNGNRSVLDRAVRRALATADPSRPIVASSGVWPHPPGMDGTDVHLSLGWERGEADDLAGIARAVPRAVRFVQITPSPSLPDDASFSRPRRWPDLDLDRLVDEHDLDVELLMQRLPPDAFATFDEWHTATRTYQAQLVRTQVETLRRLKYRPTGGFVVAHLGDLHPTFAPSLIDHEGNAKPAFDALREAAAPVIVTLDPWPHCLHPGDRLDCEVHAISDLRVPIDDARCTVRVMWDSGEERWEFGGDLDADTCTRVGTIRLPVPAAATRLTAEVTLTADHPSTGERSTTNGYTAPIHQHH
jgi:beta-mannosidase